MRKPPVAKGADRTVRPGDMTAKDLRAYRALSQQPTRTDYRGLDVYGMAPSSSGGTTVAEALNILQRSDLGSLSNKAYLHRYLEASRIAFADRGRWVGDPAQEDVPTEGLTSQRFADLRACLIHDDKVLKSRSHRATRVLHRSASAATATRRRPPRTRERTPRISPSPTSGATSPRTP